MYKRNNKLKFILIIVTILISFMCIFCRENKTEAVSDIKVPDKLILIDPGHGGMDGGAVSNNGIVEKNINLSISLKIRDKLKQSGYRVMMTRDTDRGLYTKSGNINVMKAEDLTNRCRMKRDSKSDLFISIHQNFFSQSSCQGAQIWYSKNRASSQFAHILQENMKKDLGNNNREEKEARGEYKILRCYSNIPSVIVECGFLTNPREERKLITDEYQEKVSDSIVRSINEYFESQ